MISKHEIRKVLDKYDKQTIHIGCIGSHSALEIAYGAHEEGFKTVVVCQKGREKTYTTYYANLFDEIIEVDRFSDITNPIILNKLERLNTIFIPNRSFSVYVGYDNIENQFFIPIFGSRNLLRAEERDIKKDQFYLLQKAELNHPKQFTNPRDIDRLVMVKASHAKKKVERGFFTCHSYVTFIEKSRELINQGIIAKEDLHQAKIEEFIIGALFNLDYFYAPVKNDLEFLGVDQRIETDIEGILHMTSDEQGSIREIIEKKEYIPIGHRGITVRESQLEKIFDMGWRFVEATKKEYPPEL